jgi:exopolysaccharide biosynthesis operon protein EpsL
MLSYLPNKTKPTFTLAAGARRFCLLLAALSSMPAMAGPEGAFHVLGGVGYGHDDNLLRVPDGQPAFNNKLDDSWYSAEAGLLFDHTYSRQHITARAIWSRVKFDFFQQLDYSGKDYLAKWDWQLGNHLEGKIGGTYLETLAPYTDAHTSERNLRRQRSVYADGGWRPHGSYRLRAAVSKDKFSYELESQSFNDRTENAWEVGFDYLPASGSEFGLVLRRLSGIYPNRRQLGQQAIDQDYDQDEIKAKVLWIATGSTTVQALAGWGKRDYRGQVGEDTSGINGRVSVAYRPNGKFNYSAALWRDFAPIESPVVSYTLNSGASIGVGYEASDKLKFDANAVYERRKYNARFLTNAREDLDDSVRFANLRATWAPHAKVQLSAALMHQARTGSTFLGIGSFTANSIQLNANVKY